MREVKSMSTHVQRLIPSKSQIFFDELPVSKNTTGACTEIGEKPLETTGNCGGWANNQFEKRIKTDAGRFSE